jgi:hypothetical protein
MYTPLLLLHSWLRWAVIIAGLLAVARALAGARTRRPFTPLDQSTARGFTLALDVQLLLGLVLHLGVSPFTTEAFGDFGATMRNAPLRFFVVEHPVGMLIAVALAHIGNARLKKRSESAARHKIAFVFFGLALLIILLSIPWPGLPAGRPLFKGL